MSNLPGWYSAAVQTHLDKQAALRASMQPIEVKVGEDFNSAPGWRELGIEYSCVPDAQYPWDPAVLKAIWSFDPGVIPLWVKWAFMSPREGQEETVVFGRHGIGRHVKNPHGDLPVLQVSMPTMPCNGVTFGRPNMVELVVQGEPDKRASDLPGAYQPFGWGLYHYLRAQYAVRTKAELLKVAIHDPKRVADERLERARAEEAYRRADVERFVDKKLHEVSELEMRDRMLGKRQRARSLFLDMAGSGLPASSGAKS